MPPISSRSSLDLVFLTETKINSCRWDFFKIKLKFDECFVVESLGRSGGVALLWKMEICVLIQSFCKSHINACIKTQNPNSLASKILKAKYFPKSGFFNAKPKSNASFIWRSLKAARQLLEETLMWKIGNGESVRIWQDKWISKTIYLHFQNPNTSKYIRCTCKG